VYRLHNHIVHRSVLRLQSVVNVSQHHQNEGKDALKCYIISIADHHKFYTAISSSLHANKNILVFLMYPKLPPKPKSFQSTVYPFPKPLDFSTVFWFTYMLKLYRVIWWIYSSRYCPQNKTAKLLQKLVRIVNIW